MSTLTTEIRNALAARGVDVKEVETIKNGVKCQGFQIQSEEKIRPVVYYSQDENIEAFVEKVIEIANRPTLNMNVDNLITRENLLNNSFLCLQKQGVEKIIKREYLNLEIYVRLSITDFSFNDSKASTKVTRSMLEMTGVTEDELFAAARKNSLFMAQICNLTEALGLSEEFVGEAPFYVGTYSDKCHGATVLALPEVIHSFCQEKGFDQLYILPSSTEEVLLLPDMDGDPAMLANMVNEVNTTEVDPIMQFDPIVYIYDDASETVSIAASFEERGC